MIKVEATTSNSYKKVKKSYEEVKPLRQTEERANKEKQHNIKIKIKRYNIKLPRKQRGLEFITKIIRALVQHTLLVRHYKYTGYYVYSQKNWKHIYLGQVSWKFNNYILKNFRHTEDVFCIVTDLEEPATDLNTRHMPEDLT